MLWRYHAELVPVGLLVMGVLALLVVLMLAAALATVARPAAVQRRASVASRRDVALSEFLLVDRYVRGLVDDEEYHRAHAALRHRVTRPPR